MNRKHEILNAMTFVLNVSLDTSMETMHISSTVPQITVALRHPVRT